MCPEEETERGQLLLTQVTDSSAKSEVGRLSLLPFGSLMVMSPEEGVGLGLERGEDNEGGGKGLFFKKWH